MSASKIKVLYIAGWGRSGSTILNDILGQIEGFFSVGEARYIWDHGLIANWPCGCGVPFKECAVWQKVLDEAFGGANCVSAHTLCSLRERVRTSHLPLILLPGGESWLMSRLGEYPASLERLYRAIQTTIGCRVIVDSSKFPSYAWVLETIPGIDLYIVHLIRDPRGVAYSWRSKAALLGYHSPVDSSLHWSIWNLALEALGRHSSQQYLIVRYEDFVDKPQETIERVLDLVQERAAHLPFVTGQEVQLSTNHTVAGNLSRFQTGLVRLQLDDEWRMRIRPSDRFTVTALTWPLLRKYGYL
jgi:hypothetical protein